MEVTQLDHTYGLVVSSYNTDIVSNDPTFDKATISPCYHEEADTRLILHAYDCTSKNLTKLLIRTVDTEEVVLAITFFCKLSAEEMWVAFGVGKNYRVLAIHELINILGQHRAEALTGFHAFTGCDQKLFFNDRGKKTAFQIYMSFDDCVEVKTMPNGPAK